MDATDVRILRTMGIQLYGRSPRDPAQLRAPALARALKMSPEAVKARVQRLERDGVIAGYEVYPNFRHLGLEASCFYFRHADGELSEKAAQELQAVEGVVGMYQFLGGVACVMLWSRGVGDMERKLRLLRTVLGQGQLEKFYDLEMPAVTRPLSSLDWRILRALRGRALRPLPEVGRELKVSARTVKRRFDRMAKEGSFFIVPQVDPSKAEGTMMFAMMFHLDPEATPGTLAGIRRAFDASMVSVDVPATLSLGSYAAMLFTRSAGELRALQRKGAAIPGVRKATPFLFQDAFETFGWLDEAIEARVREAPPGAAR